MEEFEDARELFEHEIGPVDALVNLPDALELLTTARDEDEEEEEIAAASRARDQLPSVDGTGLEVPEQLLSTATSGSASERSEKRLRRWGDAAAPQDRDLHTHAVLDSRATPPDQLRNLNLRLRRIFREQWKPQHILLKDKLSFLLGCTMLWGCAFWLGRSPQTFFCLYTAVGLTLFVIRFFTYRRRRQHYYLFDFCYMANLLLLLHLWLLPDWALLQQVTFAFNTGPLTWTILAFRNSLVFHDLDKVTSLFLHLVPAFVSWSLHWYPEDTSPPPGAAVWALSNMRSAFGSLIGLGPHGRQCPAGVSGSGECPRLPHVAQLSSHVLVPMSLYLLWAVLYYLQIFVFSAKKIQQRGYQTLFKYVTTQKHGTFHSISKRVPPRWQPTVYLFLHLCFCLCTLFIAVPCWQYYTAHTALLVLVATASIWTGASYYFEVFALRYHESITQAIKQAETESQICPVTPQSKSR